MEHWLLERALIFVPLLLSLTVHEWAHAFAADQLGDDTARHLGRLTLDPLAHMDPVGTLVLPLLGVPFGWAKPVPVNPNRFRVDERLGMLLTASAGPASNLLIAAFAAVGTAVVGAGAIGAALANVVVLNVTLALFNLVPVPPLDGSRVAEWAMPRPLRPAWDALSGLGMWPVAGVAILLPILGVDLSLPGRALASWVLTTVG